MIRRIKRDSTKIEPLAIPPDPHKKAYEDFRDRLVACLNGEGFSADDMEYLAKLGTKFERIAEPTFGVTIAGDPAITLGELEFSDKPNDLDGDEWVAEVVTLLISEGMPEHFAWEYARSMVEFYYDEGWSPADAVAQDTGHGDRDE